MTGNADKIKNALKSPQLMDRYFETHQSIEVIADITAYAQSQQKEPDRVEIMQKFMMQEIDGNKSVSPSFFLEQLGYHRESHWKSEYYYQYCAQEAAKATDALIKALKQSKQ